MTRRTTWPVVVVALDYNSTNLISSSYAPSCICVHHLDGLMNGKTTQEQEYGLIRLSCMSCRNWRSSSTKLFAYGRKTEATQEGGGSSVLSCVNFRRCFNFSLAADPRRYEIR